MRTAIASRALDARICVAQESFFPSCAFGVNAHNNLPFPTRQHFMRCRVPAISDVPLLSRCEFLSETARRHRVLGREEPVVRRERDLGRLSMATARSVAPSWRASRSGTGAVSRITQIRAVSDHPNSRTWGFGFG